VEIDNKPDLAIDQAQAETSTMIKGLRKRGLSMGAIADRLNSEGVPTKRGGKWYASTVQYILNNRLYKGVVEHGHIKTKRLDLAIA